MGEPKSLPYDSYWHASYSQVSRFLAHADPATSRRFEREIDRLRVDPAFSKQLVRGFLSPSTRRSLIDVISSLGKEDLELHEVLQFGRTVKHDHPVCNELQVELTARVSELVGERVEPSYNFLSMYNNLGVCELHMDAPNAKWTLDCCIEQSAPWPIFLGPVQAWPAYPEDFGPGWQERVKAQADFRQTTLEPGDALTFGGSSQWHYRDRIPRPQSENFCHLVFFHFIPAGTAGFVEPENWADYFGVPAISEHIIPTALVEADSFVPGYRSGS